MNIESKSYFGASSKSYGGYWHELKKGKQTILDEYYINCVLHCANT